MEKRYARYKWILYIAVILITMLLQSTLLSNVRIFGGAPSLMPYAISVIAMFEGVFGGAAAGLTAGLLMDAMTSPAEGFYTVLYVACGILISLLNNFIYWKNFGVSLIYGFLAMLLTNLFYYLIFMLTMGQAGITSLIRVIPGELVCMLIFTPLLYLAMRTIHRRYRIEDEETF